ncbi:DUF4380 domain-containing protein [Flagellimonas olearia]|uniref:DUF4380 domain-containing protein n=1 Tax=Flagellimonas olearia TaxID=552546 RepID=A0A6I1E0X7_9FLAO|nr:DUF4380 domain-containing protein [Allomuricauda olearia]KAB7530252.1 DUF4380 domain-containing protein [Allomuricauda olearia]
MDFRIFNGTMGMLCLWMLLFPSCMDKEHVVPILEDGRYTIQLGNQIMEIDPSTGGRITSLKLDGENFLTDENVDSFNWGSTFWPSPQSDWGWPPSPELDNKPYTDASMGPVVKMVSGKDPKTGYVITKAIRGKTTTASFLITYSITNTSDSVQKVAPWEVTRVHINGMAFYPMGAGKRTGGLLPLVTERKGIVWFVYDGGGLPTSGDRQLYSDGSEGWLAQVNDSVILVKKFEDIAWIDKAPEEGEVELFASDIRKTGTGYVEIEHQGAYQELEPGESLVWDVEWFLRKLPPEITPEMGNDRLVEYVRDLIQARP